ncbi:MarR family winged helix-turn-helix transcriptional regulator [Staphylococcus epidermidis]|jgi:DNA-binding MarR family transcriptional regulator|uniref:MarR family winged helix-turn-helix transcriptional regulator n=1 Tax=Staphylococcus TaxID=1279 RepID=UPI00050914F0|nr:MULTISPECIES: MarR family transcriptional regulator [Staphylococcus]AIR82516.1 transcriptional regulator TcaR [Staphylococcus epidermidis]KAB2285505.1 MarR family transcriptional regulator [Staphylococcus epidermidis]MBF2172917.1 MarR family transcriptional regulator [Staphylococcus epidermidis]MBF2175155.1 MarR family transcriptional regulator [Staphylococcus epidermidis]MBF2186662.1 MarR family transcriptional regulator [Staphylococcus epidermidis]
MVRRIEDHISFLEKFINDVNTLTAKLLKDLQTEYGISAEQSHVLNMLSIEALTVGQITEKQGVNKAAVSRRVKKLLNAELVKLEKTDSNTDQRLKIIKLSNKGKKYIKERKAIMSHIASDMTSDFESKEIEKVRQVLEIIDHRIQSYTSKL